MSTATRRDTRSGRFYDINGESYPSVTTILEVLAKPALVRWAANVERTMVMETAATLYDHLDGQPRMPREAYLALLKERLGETRAHVREANKAKDIGSQAHQRIEWLLLRMLGHDVGPEPVIADAALWASMACEDWFKSASVTPLMTEQMVWSNPSGYAGTLDLVAMVNGRRAVVDFKTSKGIYAESFLQNIAYQRALADMGHEPADVGYVVRIPKHEDDPAFEVVEVPPAETLWPVFEAVLTSWRWWWAEDQKQLEAWKRKR